MSSGETDSTRGGPSSVDSSAPSCPGSALTTAIPSCSKTVSVDATAPSSPASSRELTTSVNPASWRMLAGSASSANTMMNLPVVSGGVVSVGPSGVVPTWDEGPDSIMGVLLSVWTPRRAERRALQ
jgi:hypothetical protein